MAHRDGSGESRLRVAPWLPSTSSGGRVPGPRRPDADDDRPAVDVASVPEQAVEESPPTPLRPVRLDPAARRRGRWWFVVVPAAVIVLLIAVAVQLRPGAEPDRPPLPELSPQVLPELTAPPSAGVASDGPTASASPSPSGSRRASGPPTATTRPGTGGPGTGAPPTSTAPPATIAAVQPGSIVGADGRCLEPVAARAGEAIRPAQCAPVEKQKWSAPGDGTLRVQGFCLDVFFDRRDNGAAVLLYDCHGGGNQQWRIAADGWRNPQSGRCLTAVAAGLAITDCTGAANQRFSLT